MISPKSLWLAMLLLFVAPTLFAQQTDSAYVREHYTKIEQTYSNAGWH